MIFSPSFVPKIKLNRSPGASLKFSSGTRGMESYWKSAPFGILNRMLLFILPHEVDRVTIVKRRENRNIVDFFKVNFLIILDNSILRLSQDVGSCISRIRFAILSFSFFREVRHFQLKV